jgi:hypothetical protein
LQPARPDVSNGPRSRIRGRRSRVVRTRRVEVESGVVVPGQTGCRGLTRQLGGPPSGRPSGGAREGMSRHSRVRRARSPGCPPGNARSRRRAIDASPAHACCETKSSTRRLNISGIS